jgi:hypothetical protein
MLGAVELITNVPAIEELPKSLAVPDVQIELPEKHVRRASSLSHGALTSCDKSKSCARASL